MSGFTCNLDELLAGMVADASLLPSQEVLGVAVSSQAIQAGELFLAYPGACLDGRAFISEALQQGAVAIAYESEDKTAAWQRGLQRQYPQIPMIAVQGLGERASEIAARFYLNPTQQMTVIACTGTNGKTSVTHFLAQSLHGLGHACGVIGSLGAGFLDALNETGLTMPGPVVLQQQLAELRAQGAEYVAMEVSSHGLAQHRGRGIAFDIAVLTNLTRDHLDYHGSMESYGAAKRKLFLSPNLHCAVINLDDPFGYKLAQELAGTLQVYGYHLAPLPSAIPEITGVVTVTTLDLTLDGMRIELTSPWGEGCLVTPLFGQFNAYNLTAVLAVLCVAGMPFSQALIQLSQVKPVRGRMNVFGGGEQPLVVVDYAHTPDALEKVLSSLKAHCQRKLHCLFGCGGGRDSGKRQLMGRVAELHSDSLTITNDNPRSEDPQKIINDIVSDLLCPWAVDIELDRKIAIARVIQEAKPGDVVLVAGKGHENYQWVGKSRLPFSDIEQVQLQLSLYENNNKDAG